jgi:hypothetical protein
VNPVVNGTAGGARSVSRAEGAVDDFDGEE